MKRVRNILLLGAVFVALAGCDSDTPNIVPGRYVGTLKTHLDGKTYNQIAVRADIQGDQYHMPDIALTDGRGRTRARFEVLSVAGKSVTVNVTPGLSGPVTLTQSPEPQCYEASTNRKVILCSSGSEISFEISDARNGSVYLSVVLYPNQPKNTIAPEKPRAFRASEVISIARHRNFSSRIEVEHVIQAKLAVRAAYLNLLPKLNLGNLASNGLSALVPTFPTTLAGIANLPSFLLPNRWINIGMAEEQDRAEQDGYRLVRLNTVATIEGMIYAYIRDRRAMELTQGLYQEAARVREEVATREDLGLLPLGSTGNMDSILNQIRQNITVFDQVLVEDRSAMSQAMGFFNPKTVIDITLDQEAAPIESAPAVSFESINNGALSRSVEMDQIDHFIRAASRGQFSQMFAFLDPESDPSLGLGFGLPTQLEITGSKIRELGIIRQQMQASVSTSALNAITDYNESIRMFREANEGVGIQQKLLSVALNNLQLGMKIDFFGLVQVYQNYLAAQIQAETARANFRVAKAKINRLLLQGYYVKF